MTKTKTIIANKKTAQEYIKDFETTSDCRTWIINNLDLSLNWEVQSVEDLLQEHKSYCDKNNLEYEFIYEDDIVNNKGSIWEIKNKSEQPKKQSKEYKKSLTNQISITLSERKDNRKFYESTLDAYSLKEYDTFYKENKTKVNADIRQLSIKYGTIVPKDLVMLLFAEFLSSKNKKIYLEKHLKEITKTKR